MERKGFEDCTNNELESKCNDIPFELKKTSALSLASIQSAAVVENQVSVNTFASPTPEKRLRPLMNKNKGITLPIEAIRKLSQSYQDEGHAIELPDGLSEDEDHTIELPDDRSEDEEVELSCDKTENEVQIPDKYRTLAELFDRLDTSVRLLKLRKKLPTFHNICSMVEVLTKRKLSYTYLAQIKYLLPEAVQIEKILLHDEKTLCMVPDMKVTLLTDIIDVPSNQSPFMALRRVFHLKLVDFFNNHPEVSDIPEALLPEPFSQTNDAVFSEPWLTGPSVDCHTSLVEAEPELLIATSLSHCTRRHFSKRINFPETPKTQMLVSLSYPVPVSSGNQTYEVIRSPQQEEPSSKVSKSKSICSPAAQIVSPQHSVSSTTCQNSPVKGPSLPQPLMVETPAQPTPLRRILPSSDDKINTETRTVSHVAAKRSLDFSVLKDDGSDKSSMFDESLGNIDNMFKTVSTKSVFGENRFTASLSALSGKVKLNREEVMSLTGRVKSQETLDIFNIIHNIFQSVNCSLITKQELLQKIIANNLDIVEIREAEEQLDLLEKLVPDWICQKMVPGGDLFYSISKVSDMESILARLTAAV